MPNPSHHIHTVGHSSHAPAAAFRQRSPHDVELILTGRWTMDQAPPQPDTILTCLAGPPNLAAVSFDCRALEQWDSTLVIFIAAVFHDCKKRRIACDPNGLPTTLQALLELASPDDNPQTITEPHHNAASMLGRLGNEALTLARATGEMMRFFGEGILVLQRLPRGGVKFRMSEFWLIVESAGADALPIVSLVCFLVGMIFAYISNQQLSQFGARIYIADLVGLAMVIQIGALVTAIVLAGRTGAAFAAQIGAMQANEEIDALRTLGISPMEFLVLPRMLALILMTPLLALYADLCGILGGAFVGSTVAGLTASEYFVETRSAIAVNHLAQGLISATVYGAIVAASGCLRGMQCGRSAADVGQATTSAVVTAILFIVIAAAVLTVLFQAIGLS